MPMKAIVDERGRITIPAEIRRRIHLTRGMELIVEIKGDSIVLKPLRKIRAKVLLGIAGSEKVEVSEVEASLAHTSDLKELHKA